MVSRNVSEVQAVYFMCFIRFSDWSWSATVSIYLCSSCSQERFPRALMFVYQTLVHESLAWSGKRLVNSF